MPRPLYLLAAVIAVGLCASAGGAALAGEAPGPGGDQYMEPGFFEHSYQDQSGYMQTGNTLKNSLFTGDEDEDLNESDESSGADNQVEDELFDDDYFGYDSVGSNVIPAATGYTVGESTASQPVYTREEVLQYMRDDRAPDFSLQATTGSWLSLSDCRGRPVLLFFWTSLTSESLDSLRELRRVSSLYPDMRILAVNVLPDENNHAQWTEQAFFDHIAWINGYFAENGCGFSALLDINGEASRAYGLDRIPMTYFIDRDGVIRIPWSGRLTRDTLDTLVSMMRALDG